MIQLIDDLLNRARYFLFKITNHSTTLIVIFAYILISLPFFIYHEWHLPWHYITFLSLFAVLLGGILIYGTLFLIQRYWKEPYHPLMEIGALAIFVFALWSSDVFIFRAGRVFFFMFMFLLILVRLLKIDFFLKILFATVLLVGNGLLSFRGLQGVEIASSYLLFKNKYNFEEVDLNNWKKTENNYWNDEIKIGFSLAEEFIFYLPKDLELENKTGAGQIAGIIGSSDNDPNRYPFIRFFYFPSYVPFELNQATQEISLLLKMQVSKEEIEDLQEIATEEKAIPNLGSKFWTFYDSLRPRYAKTGFILIENLSHDKILMHITENLEKGQDHEPGIESILKSFIFSDTVKSDN
ncbi:hypothetical protein [Leptospira ognonensis]|uniref:hypothetical protein n=1 Tax=Leptospira ognonensis TaxID=2484945 RepID=UPI001AEF7263|nr:hypothetical protein [Leptospira ognonensis]